VSEKVCKKSGTENEPAANSSISARSDQVDSPGRKELAQEQLLEHDLFAKVVSTFGVHALGKLASRFPL
jgi:hypothetical protein